MHHFTFWTQVIHLETWQKGSKSLRLTSPLWSSGGAQLEVNFVVVKSFDVNIAIIGNLVLIVKNSIQMKQ